MFMKCHYELFPFIFFKFNLEQIYFPKIQNIKKTKCMLKYYIETKNYCSKTKYSARRALRRETENRSVQFNFLIYVSISKHIYFALRFFSQRPRTPQDIEIFHIIHSMLKMF